MKCACNATVVPRYYIKVARTKSGPLFSVRDRETTSCAGVHLVMWGGLSIATAMKVARMHNMET